MIILIYIPSMLQSHMKKGSEPYELENDPELPDSMTITSLLRL